jgi:heme/copper-type cytochrome/quinol oxidase subunit 4
MRKKGLMTAVLLLIAFTAIPMAVQAQEETDYEYPLLPFAGTMLIIINIISLVIAILICVFMYKDAEKRGKSGVLWAIIGFFCGCIGLIIWLIVRPPIQQAPPPGYYPPPQQPGYPPQQPGYPPQQPGYPPQQPPR